MKQPALKIAEPSPGMEAIVHYPSVEGVGSYLNRTRRNHFWLGGEANQLRLRDLTVGVAGLGGMGSHIAEHLVRLGVGHLKIADPDHIEETNLNRQPIARRETLGRAKVEASVEELRGIATDFTLDAYREGITADNVESFVEGCDVIVNEIDVYPLAAHVLLHRAARRRNLPVYSALSVGWGIHFYKFQGEAYRFEDFLGVGPEIYENPSAGFLIDRFAVPRPGYLTPEAESGFKKEIESGGTPILGPSTLLGHSTVVIRILMDLFGESLEEKWRTKGIPRTPVMPEFIALDMGEFSLRVTSVQQESRTE